MIQAIILIMSGATVFLLAQKGDKAKFYGHIVGLCSEPFWLWSAWHNGQWGIIILCFWYAYSYGLGIRNHYE